MKWALATDYEVLLAEDRVGALEMFKSNRHDARFRLAALSQ